MFSKLYFLFSLLIISLCCVCMPIKAIENHQSPASLTGKVIDSENNPLEGVAVLLLKGEEVVENLLTNENGEFNLGSVPDNSAVYNIKLYLIGYEPLEVPFDASNLNFTLNRKVNVLKELVVTKRRPKMSKQGAKFIFTPGELIKLAPDAKNLLMMVPMVNLTDEAITIAGKGKSFIQIVGSNIPAMSQEATIQFLQSIPPDKIASIEINTNPGASTSSSFTGAVVTVRLTEPLVGLMGNLRVKGTYTQDRFAPQSSLYLALSRKKFSMSANLSQYMSNKLYKTEGIYEYFDLKTTNRNTNRESTHYNSYSGQVNLNYKFDPSFLVGAGGSIGMANSTSKNTGITNKTVDSEKMPEIRSDIIAHQPIERPVYSVYGFITKRFNQRHVFDISGGYSNSTSRTNTDIINPDQHYIQRTDYDVDGFNASLKYTTYIAKGLFNAGYTVFRYKNRNYFLDKGVEDNFIYTQMSNSLFATYDRWLSKRVNLSAGLRLEMYDNKGLQVETEKEFNNKHTEFIPNLSLSWQMPWHDQNLSFTYSRHVMQPQYIDLNPFVRWTSENTYQSGNMNLKPYVRNNISLDYFFLKDFMLRASYNFGKDNMMNAVLNDGDYLNYTTINAGKSGELWSSFSYNRQITKFLYFKTSIDFVYTDTKADYNNVNLGYKSSQWIWENSLFFNISRKFGFSGNVWYTLSSPMKALTRQGYWRNNLRVTLNKKLGKNASLSFSANNITGFRNNRHFANDIYAYKTINHGMRQNYELSFSYSFGNNNFKGISERSSDLQSKIGSASN